MKKKRNISCLCACLGIVLFIMLGAECDPDKTEPEIATQFLTLHNNDAGRVGAGSYISVMSVKKGEPEFSMMDIKVDQKGTRGEQYFYPPETRALFDNVDVLGDKIAVRLHADFNYVDPSPQGSHSRSTRGVLIDSKRMTFEWLPLHPAARPAHEYLHIHSCPRISESGHVVYASGWDDRLYWDTWTEVGIRYNPSGKDYVSTKNTLQFCKGQPGVQASVATVSHDIFSSDDGKFMYGTVKGFNWVGGIGGLTIQMLCKYEFSNQTYTRLGDATDNKVTLLGWTSDKKWMYYLSNNKYKLVNLDNNSVKEVTNQIPSIAALEKPFNKTRWNSSGYVMDSSRKIIYVNVVGSRTVEIPVPDNPLFSQFSPDGGKVYFMLKSNRGNYLCLTSGLNETATTDTICVLPSDVREFMVIR